MGRHVHSLTDGTAKYIHWMETGREQLFNLDNDPTECDDLVVSGKTGDRIPYWRGRLLEVLDAHRDVYGEEMEKIRSEKSK